MQPEGNLADVSIETFADTCMKLAARDCDRAAVLGGSGLTEERWSIVSSAWARRLTGSTDDARGLAERFGKTYGEKIAARLGGLAQETAPAPPLAPSSGPPEPPPLLTPSFLLPPEPPPLRAGGESPWACTVPLEGVAPGDALPFRTAKGPRPPAIAPPRSEPSAPAMTDEDTERTVMAPPVVRARPFRKKAQRD